MAGPRSGSSDSSKGTCVLVTLPAPGHTNSDKSEKNLRDPPRKVLMSVLRRLHTGSLVPTTLLMGVP